MAFDFGFSAMSTKAVDSTLEICVSAASHTIDHLIAGDVAGGDLRTEVERNQTPTLRCCIHIGVHLHEPDPCVYAPAVRPAATHDVNVTAQPSHAPIIFFKSSSRL